MNVDVILGLQWGDEGKGKIVDVFTGRYDVIARFQGGPNAGHTLEFEGIKHVLHTIPSGIFHANKINLIGNGVIIDPRIFLQELRKLEPHGVDYRKNLYISRRAHLILPTHRLIDACMEQSKGDAKIGSTLKGIGPTYTDKVARQGLRIGDLERPDFMERYTRLRDWHLRQMKGFGFDHTQHLLEGSTLEAYEKGWLEAATFIKELNLCDSEWMINQWIGEGKKILAEGAQGTMLDIDFGSYPFVTSSNTITAGVCSGLGISPKLIGEIYGVFKAYCTRVGSGPFPTELHDEVGERIRVQGHEFGSTTGRPRRCGWIDIPALRYATMINGVTQLIMTKADVLNDFDTVGICDGYLSNGSPVEHWGFHCEDAQIEPQCHHVPGWKSDISKTTQMQELPEAFMNYVENIEQLLGLPVAYISTGPNRSQIIEKMKNEK